MGNQVIPENFDGVERSRRDEEGQHHYTHLEQGKPSRNNDNAKACHHTAKRRYGIWDNMG